MTTLAAPERNEEVGKEEPPITAEGLLRRRARQRPEALALSDPPNTEALRLGRSRSYSYGEADAAVDALAAFFIEIGLKPGDKVAVQLPNLAVQPLTLLAAWRAGLSVALLPMLWRGYEIGKVCELVEPKALIGVSAFAGGRPAEELCRVAAPHLFVRFVLAFGQDLPDGVASLDEAILPRSGARAVVAPPRKGPALISFTARAEMPFVPVPRNEDELLAQGAMTVVALSLDSRDVILNPYPLTGPAGLALALAPWLISGSQLAQHQPFDYAAFVQQLLATGTTVTALPSPVLEELAKDRVLEERRCALRRIGAVWTTHEHALPLSLGTGALLFDLYPLGDLAGVVLRRETRLSHSPLPLGPISVSENGDAAVFVETRLRQEDDAAAGGARSGEVLLRGPVVPQGARKAPLLPDSEGYVATGLRAEIEQDGVAPSLRLLRDPELLHHGGFAIAASELDGLYQAFPGFLDAACFSLSDPLLGDRIFAAVSPKPGEPVSLEALIEFLERRRVAPYKFPDKLLVVREVPREASGRILRAKILEQV
ncbi:class I adenylate-forming enzyme family protein [Methyloceanibacter sp.]|uniref:class I adenylate-forming enzyme family protein n=1 Tax=Methyloceanibacter sp. TaxID=1965321 RepID=UPI002D37AB20|nr:class I adenylate-forming enzyme family protein [Methyloceanibacter sp.]HZP09577.1 class I adenylate-forming enzyme family protein [Methyloceanibacter sp.]